MKSFIFLNIFACLSLYAGFSPDTLIKTVSGFAPIQDIRKESVESYDFSQHCRRDVVNSRAVVHEVATRIELENGASVICSCDQLWFEANSKTWKTASELQIGNQLLTYDALTIPVAKITQIHESTIRLFEISIQEPHTYFATENALLVHNAQFAPVLLATSPISSLGMHTVAAVMGPLAFIPYFYKWIKNRWVNAKDMKSVINAQNISHQELGQFYPSLPPIDPDKDKKKSDENNQIRWGRWEDLNKTTINGKQYAVIRGRPYTQHAIERMMPHSEKSSFVNKSADQCIKLPKDVEYPGRYLPPMVVEDVINNGRILKTQSTTSGAIRVTKQLNGIQVTLENEIVITVLYSSKNI